MPQIPEGSAAAVFIAGGTVGACAAAATAHGLYEVSVAALVPSAIAVLYPVITDGLALVAYAASDRLTGAAAGYAWAVVVLAAGLSGLAQAAYLASADANGALHLSATVRFGIGVWPAVAAALVAHLLFLIGSTTAGRSAGQPTMTEADPETETETETEAEAETDDAPDAGRAPLPAASASGPDLDDRSTPDRRAATEEDEEEADTDDPEADEEPLPEDPAVFADRELEAGRTAGQKKIHSRYPDLTAWQARQVSEKSRARYADRHTFRPSVVGGEQR